MPSEPHRRNLLGNASSPYLLQHRDNPVHWRQWGPEALEEARQLNRPILLSIGYAACHWCHVMAHESFENESIADLMNAKFINIKVDREERPDIDQIYMTALHALGEQGGWPLTMFLDPDGRPFWGGTYFPPERRYGRPGFPELLAAIDNAWKTDRAGIAKSASVLLNYLTHETDASNQSQPDAAGFAGFSEAVLRLHDPVNGGLRGNPKFPNAPFTETWLRAAGGEAHGQAGQAFLHTIARMSLGGIYDHLAGGLSRYSVDGLWLVPHFEKMLYDNAHYLRALAWAEQLSPHDLFRTRIEQTIAWAETEMLLPDGAFAASLDADSDGEEGKFYLWSKSEIAETLGQDAIDFCKRYDVTETGNFEGVNILNRLNDSIPIDDGEKDTKLRAALLALRNKRTRPGLDDKILTDWNGYFIRALAECAFVFRRPQWLSLAKNAFRCIAESMDANGRLPHSRRRGVEVRPALATDYGAMINAALSLSMATGDKTYLDDSKRWAEILEAEYAEAHGGYYLTSSKAAALIVRPACDTDEANPSAASQILEALVRLASLCGEQHWLDRAYRLSAQLHSRLSEARHGSAGFWNAVHTLLNHRHVTISAQDEASAEPYVAILRRTADPALTFHIEIGQAGHRFMGLQIAASQGVPSAIICSRQSCSAPITDPEELKARLNKQA
jgi:hypothetical protein